MNKKPFCNTDLWAEMLQKYYIEKVPQNELEPHSGKSCYILYIIIICPDVRLSVPTFYLVKWVHKYVHTYVLYRFCAQNMCTLLSSMDFEQKSAEGRHFSESLIVCIVYKILY